MCAVKMLSSPLARSAPSPLVGEGWGLRFVAVARLAGPPPRTPPHKGEGNRTEIVARSFAHKYRVGHISVRHMCDDGVLSRPRPSFGCLKLRPMMSTKSSSLTLAFGSNE